METICSQTNHGALMGFFCFVYDSRRCSPAWLRLSSRSSPASRSGGSSGTQISRRASHRETLANLLRDALRRYQKVDQSIREPLTTASRVTSDPVGELIEIDPHDAHHLDQMFHSVLDWYLIVLADTEHSDIETRKSALKAALGTLGDTLNDAHWADHNEQQDEDHNIPDDEWAKIVARCAEAKIEVSQRVGEVQAAYRALRKAQEEWVQSLRGQIAKLDLQIAAPR